MPVRDVLSPRIPENGSRALLCKIKIKFQQNFKLSDFKSYLQYFEFYINDIVLKTFENSSSDNKLYGNAENLHSLMLNTARRKWQYSDVIVKIHTAKMVSAGVRYVNSLLHPICKSLYHTK